MTRSINEVTPRSCAHCGVEFQPLNDRAKYCTTNCQISAARARKRERDRAFREEQELMKSAPTLTLENLEKGEA